jgi:hypothetical protein
MPQRAALSIYAVTRDAFAHFSIKLLSATLLRKSILAFSDKWLNSFVEDSIATKRSKVRADFIERTKFFTTVVDKGFALQ